MYLFIKHLKVDLYRLHANATPNRLKLDATDYTDDAYFISDKHARAVMRNPIVQKTRKVTIGRRA
jgi:hypothetical protein